MAAAARGAGLALTINSAFRSDAEQAELFAANPDPTWVAPPGQSLHRCGTELDLGPPAAYGWLAANARPVRLSQAVLAGSPGISATSRARRRARRRRPVGGSRAGGGDGGSGGGGFPAYVPARYRAMLVRSAARWNVSAAVLAAQLMAESNFNPYAMSPAGAQGIAQFMPGTAAAYGLDDPFDAAAAIDAQAHLMSDLLGSSAPCSSRSPPTTPGPGAVAACDCVPPYPETQAYVARIMGLLDGAGELVAPTLEVRLVE